jgi:hypothetical protein
MRRAGFPLSLAGLAVAVLAAAAAVAPAALGATSTEIVAALNAQRAANGIPAGIAHRADWSQSCYEHNEYQRQNGTLTHYQSPGAPGHTASGAWAGENSVLAQGSSWSNGNPFEHAPIHLHQLLAARLSEMGADEHDGWVCATTWPGMNRPRPAEGAVYSYPGDGRRDVPADETASESPFVPGDFVGLPEGTTTGPHLYLMVDGPWEVADARIDGASLSGPGGPEDVRWVDNSTDGVGPYLPPGGIVIPARPLARGTTYTASVQLTAGGVPLSRTWSFTTRPNQPPIARFDVDRSSVATGEPVTFTSTATDPDGGPVSLAWDLDGDGQFGEATSEIVTRTFPLAGSHRIGLRATDRDGASAESFATVSVAGRSPAGQPGPAGDAGATCRAARARVRRLRARVRAATRMVRRATTPTARRRWQRIRRDRRIRLARARARASRACAATR